MKNCYLFLLFAILFSGYANSQPQRSGKITAIVQSEQQQAIENATVELLRSKDSILVKAAITDKTGLALFENLSWGTYQLRISAVGYTTKYSQLLELNAQQSEMQSGTITLAVSAASTSEVTVTSRKPFIQKLTDRIVVNVENSIVSAGSSALDVLERAPGVTVDQNDAIGLRGRQGVIIMIDGKPTPMTGADLANYLRGLPSNTIERIDIITNPSAKYDAAGNSGIIDIRMKKDQRMGTNGTVTMGYGQGIYPKSNAGLTFNHRNKKINLFGNYSYGYRMNLNHLILDRNFFDNNGIYTGGDLKDNYTKTPVHFHNTRFGIDIFPSKKTIIGAVVSANFNKIGRTNVNGSEVLNAQRQKISTFQTLANNNDHANNIVANINFKHSFNTAGKELTADVDYGEYNSSSFSRVATKYFNLNGGSLQPDYILDGDQDGKLILRTAKIDYANPLKASGRFEAGVKTSYVSADNDAKFFDVSSGTPQDDVNKTNRFKYNEYNNAGYLNFSKEFKKFSLQLGLRGEHTKINTHQLKGNIRFDSSYFQLFPSAFLNYKMKENHTLGVSVSRRIDRPGYSQLNPFLFLIDVTTYATGRPGLLPQLTWSYELSYTMKNISFTLGYSRTKQNQNVAIARFKDVFPNIPSDDNVTVQIPVNLSWQDYYGLTVSAPVRISKWWNMINNGNLYYNHFNGRLGTTQLNNGRPSFDIRTNNTFTIGNGWISELNVNYNSSGQYGFMVAKAQWGLALGVQKTVMNKKGTIRFNISDIFWTNLPRGTITYNNYLEKWRAYRETRVANLTFTYRFGKNTVQAARRRTTASEEERSRAGN
ncbi:TonB-dependent receptor [Sediminibacterium goheungense]|uniref:Outer membrane receptor protein involved in Fe transport n=1 Tax=Sediminibacterium goheungense TaxID=1086393 RepID=A0A4R6J283_9BACT|nr:TonB-dependent receptor [Sediminibacterium goheungense]TDO29333.1 outer membrane receptor protein involved in Fe transport [Sediminibacterium goheungense]